MSAQTSVLTDVRSPPLQSGDELILVRRPFPAPTVLVIRRDGKDLERDSPIGKVRGLSLKARMDRSACETYVREQAGQNGLCVSSFWESGEGFHAQVV